MTHTSSSSSEDSLGFGEFLREREDAPPAARPAQRRSHPAQAPRADWDGDGIPLMPDDGRLGDEAAPASAYTPYRPFAPAPPAHSEGVGSSLAEPPARNVGTALRSCGMRVLSVVFCLAIGAAMVLGVLGYLMSRQAPAPCASPETYSPSCAHPAPTPAGAVVSAPTLTPTTPIPTRPPTAGPTPTPVRVHVAPTNTPGSGASTLVGVVNIYNPNDYTVSGTVQLLALACETLTCPGSPPYYYCENTGAANGEETIDLPNGYVWAFTCMVDTSQFSPPPTSLPAHAFHTTETSSLNGAIKIDNPAPFTVASH